MHPLLEQRTMSGFPVSIGTGLALETIDTPEIAVYDSSREVPEKVDIGKYDIIFINAALLLRNIFSSIPSAQIFTPSAQDYYECLKSEIEYLIDKFSLEDNELVIYHSQYRVALTMAPSTKYRLPMTTKQIFMKDIETRIIKRLVKENLVTLYSDKIESMYKKAIVMTHIPYDLTCYKSYAVFHLLESHTGVLKKYNDWGSKYYPVQDKNMALIPFREDLLVKFGDHVMFKPDPIKERIELYESLVKKTKEKMR